MAGPPVNAQNAANIAMCRLARLDLPTPPRLSVKAEFIRVMLATHVNYDDLHRNDYDDHHSQGLIYA
jgi:hypothetical protein